MQAMDLVVLFDKEHIEVLHQGTDTEVVFRTKDVVKGIGDYVVTTVRLAEVIADITLFNPVHTVFTLSGISADCTHCYNSYKEGNTLSDAEIYEYARRIAAKKISIEIKRTFERVLGLVD